jgi:hypothetical protein
MRKSRSDYDQAEFYKRSHDAMYVEIDGKQHRLNKGDALTDEGRRKRDELRAGKDKEKPADPNRKKTPPLSSLSTTFLRGPKGR